MKPLPPATQRPVPSPCNSVCALDAHTGYCQGCWRTLDEITAWSTLSDDAKTALWLQLRSRSQLAAHGPTPERETRHGP